MAEAVRRGVEVKVMVPAASATDTPIVQHASHHQFSAMLKGGVKIWEYKRTLLHQKIVVVDGTWFCVGSTNFDDRSFQWNDEISMGVLDAAIAQQLRAAFADDMRFAMQRSYEEWAHRPLWHKLIDQIAYLGSPQL
jgi:cardiolipin synthase